MCSARSLIVKYWRKPTVACLQDTKCAISIHAEYESPTTTYLQRLFIYYFLITVLAKFLNLAISCSGTIQKNSFFTISAYFKTRKGVILLGGGLNLSHKSRESYCWEVGLNLSHKSRGSYCWEVGLNLSHKSRGSYCWEVGLNLSHKSRGSYCGEVGLNLSHKSRGSYCGEVGLNLSHKSRGSYCGEVGLNLSHKSRGSYCWEVALTYHINQGGHIAGRWP